MDFNYFSICDTIVCEDNFATMDDNLNNLSFLNLDNNTMTYHHGTDSGMSRGIFSDMETYKHLDVTSWRGEECLDWAREVCQMNGIDRNTVNLPAFRQVTGEDLMNFSLYDFCQFDTVYGPAFHDAFQKMLENRGIAPVGQNCVETCTNPSNGDGLHLPTTDLYDLSAAEPDEDLSEFLSYMDHPASSWDAFMSESDLPGQSELSAVSFVSQDSAIIKSEETCSEFSDDASLDGSLTCSSPEPESMVVPSCDVLSKIRTKSRKRERGPKNWEFMIRLLVDKTYNPDIIRWEDQDLKTFRLVKPMVIAQMWGQRSNKPNLSYDNFARGLRYQYTTGALKPVRERQLVYKCGPKALKFLKELQKEGY